MMDLSRARALVGEADELLALIDDKDPGSRRNLELLSQADRERVRYEIIEDLTGLANRLEMAAGQVRGQVLVMAGEL